MLGFGGANPFGRMEDEGASGLLEAASEVETEMQTRADEFARGLVADDEGGGDGETNVSAVSETRGLIEKEEGGGEAASANEAVFLEITEMLVPLEGGADEVRKAEEERGEAAVLAVDEAEEEDEARSRTEDAGGEGGGAAAANEAAAAPDLVAIEDAPAAVPTADDAIADAGPIEAHEKDSRQTEEEEAAAASAASSSGSSSSYVMPTADDPAATSTMAGGFSDEVGAPAAVGESGRTSEPITVEYAEGLPSPPSAVLAEVAISAASSASSSYAMPSAEDYATAEEAEGEGASASTIPSVDSVPAPPPAPPPPPPLLPPPPQPGSATPPGEEEEGLQKEEGPEVVAV